MLLNFILSRVKIRVQRRFFRVFFFPWRYGEPRFLQKNMKFNFIIEGTLSIFIVQHLLKANWKNWLSFAVLSRILLKSCKMNVSSKSQIQQYFRRFGTKYSKLAIHRDQNLPLKISRPTLRLGSEGWVLAGLSLQ